MWAAFANSEDFPNLGHEALDEEHKNIVRLMNDLHDAILRRSAVSEQRSLLHQLETYLRVNCRSEEEMMDADQYPNRDSHRKSHEAMYRKMYEFQKVLQDAKEEASLAGLRALREMFSRHITNEDSRVASWHRIAHISADSPD